MNRREFIKMSLQAGALAMLQMTAGCKLGDSTGRSALSLPPLPYPENALEPHISARTISFHYGKHHRAYVDAANRLAAGSGLAGLRLEEMIVQARGRESGNALFDNAAQVYNHDFFWKSMRPGGGGPPDGVLAEMIGRSFKNYEGFRRAFSQEAGSRFGSGWVWLVADGGTLRIVSSANAENPLGQGTVPLLTLDLWEHAYYLDYQNRRGEYVDAYLNHLVNWEHAANQIDAGHGRRKFIDVKVIQKTAA